ncbi:hypothetical protein ACM7NP_06390 [Pseudomonas aeruginosa]
MDLFSAALNVKSGVDCLTGFGIVEGVVETAIEAELSLEPHKGWLAES